MREIVIKNARRCRKFGVGVSTTPTGQGTDIAPPRGANYRGTIKQIERQRADDYRYLNSIQSAYKTWALFYEHDYVIAVWRFGMVDGPHENESEDRYDWFSCYTLESLIEGIGEDGSVKIRVA